MSDADDDRPTPSRRSSTPSRPGAAVDPTRVVGRYLGHGGQGVVVRGLDRHLPREVAWKIVHDDDPRAQSRLRHEARVLAMLEHPHILPVYDLADDGKTVRMATRLVRGHTLRALMTARARPPESLLRHLLAVSQAVGFAHEHGVVHRDIKPHNIMIGDRGETQVIDWGLAQVASDAEPLGGVIGTVAYMSPEQARGERVGPATDVWALGATLVEVLTGCPLWVSSEDAILAELRCGVRPRIDTSRLPAELAVILGRALAPDPESRYSDARTLAADLEAYLERSGPKRGVVPAAQPDVARPVGAARQPTRWAMSGDVSIAFQVFGAGETDLVLIPGFVSHLEVSWEDPSFARFLERLGERHRVIFFDKRGTGMSDRVDVSSLGDRLEDVRAVMDAAGSERAALFGISEGGVLALLFAALYPERVSALALYASTARSMAGPDYPIGSPPELFEWGYAEIRRKWGGPLFLEAEAPSRADDRAFVDWWARYLKMGASPGAAIAVLKANSKIDVRHLLRGISVPTLALRRNEDALTPLESARYVAEQIPGARFVALEGRDHLPFVGGSAAVLDTVLAFIAEPHPVRRDVPLVAFMLVVGPAASGGPERAAPQPAVEQRLAQTLAKHGGAAVDAPGQAHVAGIFRLPSAALACAMELMEDAAALDAPAAVALHLDVLTHGDPAPGREILQRVAEFASRGAPQSIVVTRIVRDLATRVDLTFEAHSRDRDDPEALFTMRRAMPGSP